MRTGTVAHVCFVTLDELHRQLVQFLEMVARISDLPRLEAQPADDVQSAVDVFLILSLWVCVVEAKVAASSMVLSKPKVDGYSFRVTDVEVA